MRRQIDERIETTLVSEARLVAELLTHGAPHEPATTVPELNGEAVRLGQLIGARVTFIAADGRVVADSAETPGSRRWRITATARSDRRAHGRPGQELRHSATLGIDMLMSPSRLLIR